MVSSGRFDRHPAVPLETIFFLEPRMIHLTGSHKVTKRNIVGLRPSDNLRLAQKRFPSF